MELFLAVIVVLTGIAWLIGLFDKSMPDTLPECYGEFNVKTKAERGDTQCMNCPFLSNCTEINGGFC